LIFYVWLLPDHRSDFSHIGGTSTVWVLALLSLLGAFIHETGHASALVSFGCKQTEIGFGIYLYFPVLYTDVSEAWKLSRYQRATIDIAGVYFQSVFQVLLLALFFITGSLIPIFFFLFTDLIMFRTMNPFLRMDGYWLVADLFGIFNLRQQSTKLIKHYALKLFGSSGAARPPLPNLTPRARMSLAVYSVLSTLFFFYVCEIMIRFSIFYLLPAYPGQLKTVWQLVQQWPPNLSRLFSLLSGILLRTAIMISLSIFVYRLLQTAWGVVKFLVQMLWQRFRKVFASADYADSTNRSV
jgi:putative peptide zinc metalloprotease protein